MLAEGLPSQAPTGRGEERTPVVPGEASKALGEGPSRRGEGVVHLPQVGIGFRHLEGQLAVWNPKMPPGLVEGSELGQSHDTVALKREGVDLAEVAEWKGGSPIRGTFLEERKRDSGVTFKKVQIAFIKLEYGILSLGDDLPEFIPTATVEKGVLHKPAFRDLQGAHDATAFSQGPLGSLQQAAGSPRIGQATVEVRDVRVGRASGDKYAQRPPCADPPNP